MKKRLVKMTALLVVMSSLQMSNSLGINTVNASVVVGDNAGALGATSVAVGDDATASGNQNIAIGSSAMAFGESSTAVGYNADATGNKSIAIGDEAKAYGVSSIAIGAKMSHANGSIAIGKGIEIDRNSINSIAIGVEAAAGVASSIAIGDHASISNANDVSLGSYAKTKRTVNVSGATIGNTEYSFAGNIARGAVSISYEFDGVQGTRQLQGVSAGQVSATSTDAVNGSQLYAAYQAIDALDDRVKNLENNSGNGNSIIDYVEKVEANGDKLTFTQVSTATSNTMTVGDSSEQGENTNKTTLTYTDKHISGLEQSFDNTTGKLTTSITTNEQDNGKKYEFTVDVSEYVTKKVKTEAGQGTITVGTQETTIEKAINDNRSQIEINQSNIASNTERINTIETSIADNTARIASIDSRMNKVGAGAAALASLHPLDYDRDNKFAMSAGIGNYAGTQAGAVGAFYRPNEDIMLSMASTFGNGADMVNFGVTFAIGSGKSPYASMSKKDLVHKVDQMSAEIEELKAIVAELAAKK